MLSNYLAALNNLRSTKLNASDTAAMLSSYLTGLIALNADTATLGARFSDVVSLANTKVKYTDTAAMLNKYLTGIIALDTRVTSNTASITTNTADILLRATIASPSFTGTPTVPTATTGSNNSQIANTSFVKTAIDGISIGAGQFTGIMPVANGGTGQSSFTDGQLLIGNTTGNTLTKSTLTAGTGVSITNGNGSITIAATGTGGTVTNVNPITVTASGNTFTSTVTNATSTPAIALTIPLASVAGTTAGLLSKADYDVFNAKQNALISGTNYIAPNAAITGATKTKITYDTKGLVTAGADATTADIAPSTDRNYVTDIKAVVLSNTSGVNTGDQTITLTGDVTGTGTGTFTSTIANSAVTYAKMQNVTAGKLLGSISASDASPGAVAIGSGLSLSGGTLTASGTGGTVTNVNPITVNASGNTFTSTVTNATTTPAINLTIPLASQTGTTAGLLSNTDYATFNAKQGALTAGSGISIASNTISATGLTTSNLSSSAGILNGQLANSAITLGSTSMSLGSTNTTIAGLTSVTSTGFTGALTGNASTATALATARSIYGNNFDGTAALSGVISTTFGGTGASSTSQNFVFAGPTSGAGAPGFRLLTSADVPAGSGNYIANGTTQQASSNFNISGSGVVGTSLSAGSLSLTTALSVANGGTGQNSYTTGDILYASATNTLSKLGIGTTGTVLTVSGGIPSWGSNGLYTLNGISAAGQTFGTGLSGTDFNISSSGSTHTFNIPDAGATSTTRGLVNTGAQTFYGNKTFNGGTTSVVSLSATGIVNTPNLYTTNLKVIGGTQTSGYVLTNDGSGNATWQAASAGISGIGPIASTSTANGATVSGNNLLLAPADGTNGGVVTTGAQTFAGNKTFSGALTAAGATFTKAVTNSAAYNAGAGTTIDFSQSNLAYTSASPGSFTLSNMKDGGTYTLAIQGTTTGTASFTASGLYGVSLGNYASVSGKQTVYTFVVMGTTFYYSMVSAQ